MTIIIENSANITRIETDRVTLDTSNDILFFYKAGFGYKITNKIKVLIDWFKKSNNTEILHIKVNGYLPEKEFCPHTKDLLQIKTCEIEFIQQWKT